MLYIAMENWKNSDYEPLLITDNKIAAAEAAVSKWNHLTDSEKKATEVGVEIYDLEIPEGLTAEEHWQNLVEASEEPTDCDWLSLDECIALVEGMTHDIP